MTNLVKLINLINLNNLINLINLNNLINLFSFLAYSSLSTAFTRSSMWPSSRPFQIRRGAVKQAAWIGNGFFGFSRRTSGPGGGRRTHTTGSR